MALAVDRVVCFPRLGYTFWMLIYVLIGLGILVALVLIAAARQPSTFRLERSILISASPEKIFPHINDFHQWEAWSPWAKLDPAQKSFYEGTPAGTGAIFRWDGNMKVGAGGMTITDSRASEFIEIVLEFLRPFRGTNFVQFTFRPIGDQTSVTWSMHGPQPFIGKVVSLLMGCEKMMGGCYERGLAKLKTVVEAA